MSTQTFFLGGSSPDGFRSRFGELIADSDYFTYIIKGGPGTGKSSLIKRVAAAFPDEDAELYLCSSDPSSADAVILKKRRIILVDGTSPHVFEPIYPGATQEIINLGEFWDTSMLKRHKDEIISATADYLQHHIRCRRCIAAAASVLCDTANTASAALDRAKLDGFTARLAKKLLPAKKCEGKLSFKQRCAITPLGVKTFIPQKCSIYYVNDGYFYGTDYFLRRLADKASEAGYTAEISLSSISENDLYEHLYLPELKIAFISVNCINRISADNQSGKINFSRFYNRDMLLSRRQRVKFSCNAASDLIEEAVKSLNSAKAAHDILEGYYINAVDFEKVTAFGDKLIEKLK